MIKISYKATKIWKYFYFYLLGFNVNCCIFKVMNLLELKYNPQKKVFYRFYIICFVINTITHKNNFIFEMKNEMKQSWCYINSNINEVTVYTNCCGYKIIMKMNRDKIINSCSDRQPMFVYMHHIDFIGSLLLLCH